MKAGRPELRAHLSRGEQASRRVAAESVFKRLALFVPLLSLILVHAVHAAPVVSSFSPQSDPVGTTVTINGTGFSGSAGANGVKFNNTAVTNFTSISTTKLVVVVPSGATTGHISVTVSGVTGSSMGTYTVTPAPTISSFSPTRDPVGTSVTINGTNFTASSTVKFHGTQATVASATAIQLIATVPSGATSGTITVTEGGATATGGTYTVTPPPTISNVSPGNGAPGDAVTITGANFDTTLAANNVVKFNNNVQATVTSVGATTLGVSVPSGASTGSITVTEGGATATSPSSFTVNLPHPTFSPTSGVYGTPVTITGSGFNGTTPSANIVKFNNVSATVGGATSTQLNVTVPSAATTGLVTVSVGTSMGTSQANFTVPSPTITSIPSGGAVGSQVTIGGTNFSPVAADNVVTFHGTAAVVISSAPNQIVTTVPAGATTGTVKIVVGSHSVTSGTFTITQAPTISSFAPTFGPAGIHVYVNGSNFSTNASTESVTFNGSPAQIDNAFTTGATVVVPQGATTGKIGATVNGVSTTSATNFTVVPGFSTTSGDVSFRPAIDAFSPASGAPGTLVAIRSATVGVCCWSSVSFNGTPAQIVDSTPTDLFALVPSGATTGPISIAYGSGVTSSSASNFTVIPSAPLVSGFSPTAGPVGATVTIVGSNFGTTTAANAVSINGTPATVTAAAANQLDITVPSGATTGAIQVSANGGASTSNVPFAVVAPASTSLVVDGPSNSASSTASGQSITFTFTASQGQNLGLAISNVLVTPAVATTTTTVTAPGGGTVATTGCVSGCTLELSNLPQSGTYTVTVNPNVNALVSAIATLSSQVTGTVATGTPASVNLNRFGQIARLTFAANAGDSFGLEFANLWIVPTEAVRFRVLRPDGSQLGDIAQSDGAKAVIPLVQLPVQGTYTVLVEPLTAAFKTSLQVALVAPTPISVGGSAISQDTNVAGQVGLLSFTATAGQSLDLHVETNTSFANGRISPLIYTPTGASVAPFFEPNYAFQAGTGFNYNAPRVMGCYDNSGQCQLNFIAPTAGTYLLFVAPASFNYEPGPAFAATLMASTTGGIAPDNTPHPLTFTANQTNRLSFSGTAGQSLQLNWSALTGYSGPGFGWYGPYPSVTVLNPDGTPLTWFSLVTTDASLNPVVKAGVADLPILPSTGTYTVIADLTPDSQGSITFGMTTVAAGSCAEPDGSLVAQTTLVITPSNLTVGNYYSVTATESDCNHTTGTIDFYDDLGNHCSSNTASPTACSFPATQAGQHLVAATYYPSSGNVFNSVASNTVVVAGGTSTLTLGVQVLPDSYVPGAYVVSVSVAPNAPATAQPTGIIQVANCTLYLPNTECFPVYVSGSTSFEAKYFGDATYAPAISPTVVFTNIEPLATTASVVDVEPEPAAWGTPYTVSVDVTSMYNVGMGPTGNVTVGDGTFTTSGQPNTCTFTLPAQDSCQLSTKANGFVYLTASYAGDSNYKPSQSQQRSHRVLIASQASLSIAAVGVEPSAVGQSYLVTTTISPVAPETAAPTGTVTITDGTNSCTFTLPASGCSIAQSVAGIVSLTAEYSGDAVFAGAVSIPVTHSVSSPGGPGSLAPEHEICGFDPNAAYPPPGTFIPVNQLSGFVPSPGLEASIVGSPTIKILYPPNGAIAEVTTVDIVGMVSGPLNTGVTINGTVVPVVDGYFALDSVPLAVGGNAFEATATTLTGLVQTALVSLTRTSSALPPVVSIRVASSLTTGFSPFDSTFAYSTAGLPNGASVSTVSINFGDGSAPVVDTSLTNLPTTHTYSWPGLYAPTLTVVDSNGQTYVADTKVVVQDLIKQRGMLCDVYGYLKNRLNEGDSAGAALSYQPLVRDSYSSLFDQLATDMPAAARQLGVIANGQIGLGFAELLIVRDNGDQSRNGFPLRLTQGSDGVWRISEM